MEEWKPIKNTLNFALSCKKRELIELTSTLEATPIQLKTCQLPPAPASNQKGPRQMRLPPRPS